VSIAKSNVARLYDIAEGKTPQRGIRPQNGKTAAIELKVLPMGTAGSPFPDSGFIITNPPYGKRLGDHAQAEQCYREMGSLGERFAGWKLALITDHSGFESFYGKKADSCREMSNGAIPSYFYQFDVL
jgi:putative N6-adenine-specific DNA methylase